MLELELKPFFIMKCTKWTCNECNQKDPTLNAHLFGEVENNRPFLEKVNIGDYGFLYDSWIGRNYLWGIYQAKSKIGFFKNGSKAWPNAKDAGRFSVQILVEPIGTIKCLSNAGNNLKKIGIELEKMSTGVPSPKKCYIDDLEKTRKILDLFI